MKIGKVTKLLCSWHGIRSENPFSFAYEKTVWKKLRTILSSLMLASLLTFGLFGRAGAIPVTIYVDAGVVGSDGSGSSWANAFTSLSSALTAAVSGDEIWVKSGIYTPGAARTDTCTLKNGVSIYGGFAGTETLRTQRDPATSVTILSSDIDNNDSQTPIITDLATVTGNTTNSYHVVNGGGTDSTTVLDGFTITAGNANGSNPNNCGGGIYNNSSSPTLTNVTFSGNTGGYCGGGMYNYSSSPTLTNVTFSGNTSNYNGGGMYNMMLGSSPTLTNVTFSGNSAINNGGGIHNSNNSNPTLKNVILWGNTALYGSEISNFSSTPTISYSVVKGSYTGTGNISSDPKLGALANNGGFTQTMALGAGSSAIDTGTNTGCPATDQRGVTRPQGSQCDIGAYEYDPNNDPITYIFLPLIIK